MHIALRHRELTREIGNPARIIAVCKRFENAQSFDETFVHVSVLSADQFFFMPQNTVTGALSRSTDFRAAPTQENSPSGTAPTTSA